MKTPKRDPVRARRPGWSGAARAVGVWLRRVRFAPHAALLFVLIACGPSGDGGAAGPPAPDFELSRVGGGTVSLADLRGQLVLLDFWATWCVPCVKAIPELNALHLAQKERGFQVLGVAVDDLEEPELAAWLEEKGVVYPIARATSDLAAEYGAYQFPQHVLISRDGTILEQLEPGAHSRADLEALIEPHLQ